MKKLAIAIMIVAGMSGAVYAQQDSAYNFGDFRSSTLAGKAWQALSEKNLDAVLAYSEKCIEMYGSNAKAMQAGLKEYPAGDEQKVFSFWALNDVATVLYIQGEAYRQAGKMEDAKKAFNRVVEEFSFGQAWDGGKKIFWKPAEAAKDKLNSMTKNVSLDFGDMSSGTITRKAWGALSQKDLESVIGYVNKNLEMYGAKAKEMQASLKEFPWESNEKIHSYWALNDVGTSLFILGQAYRTAGKKAEAMATFKQLVDNYGFSQCWDTQGWFWKPAEAAQQQIIELEAIK